MMKAKSGFTLVEILIVVVILGILAAIVIPQFTEASTEARVSSLCSDLQTLRSQIELYKVQHNDIPPTLLNFEAQMVETSTPAGATSGDKTRAGLFVLGPYLERVPENPFNRLNTVDASGVAGDGAGGWEYTETTGEIYADDDPAHAVY
jgi:general secretion pathway protein G